MNYISVIAAGLGTPEIILILISCLFFFTFLGLIVYLIHSAMKRQDLKQQVLPSNVAITIAGSTLVADDQKDAIDNQTLTRSIRNEKIALPQQHEIRYVVVDEIIRCEADDNYTNFFLMTGEKILISKSLKEYADLLIPHGFLRTHQSHLINPSHVKSWLKEDGGVLLMNDGNKIPVSKPNRESVKELLSKS